MTSVRVHPIRPERTHALRHDVLRPQQPASASAYPLDDAPGAFHAGAFVDEALVGVASIYAEAPPDAPDVANAWRVRGMAVHPDAQGRGIGRALLAAVTAHAVAHGGAFVWCNARITAEPFYVREGFERVGDVFDLPPLGPHVVLRRDFRKDA